MENRGTVRSVAKAMELLQLLSERGEPLSLTEIARLQEQVAFNTTARVDAAHQAVRFVTSWATTDAQVDALLAVLAQVLE